MVITSASLREPEEPKKKKEQENEQPSPDDGREDQSD